MLQIAFHQTLKVDINNNLNNFLCKISQFYDECLQLRTGPKQFSRQCEKSIVIIVMYRLPSEFLSIT